MSNAEKMVMVPCPFCGTQPELVDGRLVFFVRCTGCVPARCVIYGDSYQHIDHVEDSQSAINAVDWEQAKQSAVDRWNKRTQPPQQHQGEPVAYLACGELFKTVMGARNYAGSMPVYPLFKDVPVGSDMNARCEDLRQAVRSREALVDDLRAQLAERDALLHEVSISPDWSLSVDLQVRISNALSASAEPSALVELCNICKGYGKYQDGDSGTDEDGRCPNIVECECDDSERMPQYRASAPVEIDERSVIMAKILNAGVVCSDRGKLVTLDSVERAMDDWQARSALERKP